MNLTGLIAIAGKPGLYKVLAQSKNGLIVESLIDGKKMPAYATHKVSALEDISIYTYQEEVPLAEVYRLIYEKENGGEAINHQSKPEELKNYLLEVLPEYDQERVYNSDIKKLLSWYNLLHKTKQLNLKQEEKASSSKSEKKEEVATEAKKKKTAPKKQTTKSSEKKASPKKPADKGATVKKTTKSSAKKAK